MKTLRTLWKDDVGAVISVELILVITIVGIGLIVGLTTLRNAVVQELADTGAAVGSMNQSFTFSGVSGHASSTGGSNFTDQTDAGDTGDIAGQGANCVQVNQAAAGEGAGDLGP